LEPVHIVPGLGASTDFTSSLRDWSQYFVVPGIGASTAFVRGTASSKASSWRAWDHAIGEIKGRVQLVTGGIVTSTFCNWGYCNQFRLKME
jgi:hypothetical protein